MHKEPEAAAVTMPRRGNKAPAEAESWRSNASDDRFIGKTNMQKWNEGSSGEDVLVRRLKWRRTMPSMAASPQLTLEVDVEKPNSDRLIPAPTPQDVAKPGPLLKAKNI